MAYERLIVLDKIGNIKPFQTVLMLTVLGALLRWYGLARYSFWYDEGFTLAYADQFQWSWDFISARITSDPPLLAFAVHFWSRLAMHLGLAVGSYSFDLFLRMLPFICSVVSIPLAYVLSRSLVDRAGVALFATLLCALSPFHVYYAQELKSYSLYLMLILAAAIVHLRALKTDQCRDWTLFALLISLSLYSHFIAAWNIILFNLHTVAVQVMERKIRWKWVGTQFFAGVLCLPVILLAVDVNSIYSNITTIYSAQPEIKHVLITFKSFLAGYCSYGGIYHGVFLMTTALFFIGCYALRHKSRLLILLLFYGCLPLIANLIVWRLRTFSIYEHRLFIVCSVYVFILMAQGMAAMPQWLRRGISIPLVLLICVCLQGHYSQRLHPMESHRMGARYKVDNRAAAAHIVSNIEEGDIIAHASNFTFYPFRYYVHNPSIPQHFIYLHEEEFDGNIGSYPKIETWEHYGILPKPIDAVTAQAKRIWFVISWWEPAMIPDHVIGMKDWLDSHFQYMESVFLDGIEVRLYNSTQEKA